ncbi:AraC family transcriptional regulator [Citrobacter cronae]|uniref:helix-turn-helix domain-containing protein n=1 Tax=Citrobacter cronae TaxID=1748967 RepID=UPI002DCBE462|nr:AraC family transcriptional regulator [Citrobacter cronae]
MKTGHYNFPQIHGWTYGLSNCAPPRLNQLSQRVGACEKTISRIFIRDTGMHYQHWRQQFRLLKAMEMLADGSPGSQVAQHLEFVSDSAFIAFFRQHTGTTPARFTGK